MYYNLSWGFQFFVVKARFVSALPSSPTDGCHNKCLDKISPSQPDFYPELKLLGVSRSVGSPKAAPDYCPDSFGHRTLKEEVID